LHTLLIEGPAGSGKSTLAAWAARQSDFPFIKFVSPTHFVGFSEQQKQNQLVKIFQDAYKSPISCIVMDDLERIIEFIGNVCD
jgi:vesicle-fusing ATPase